MFTSRNKIETRVLRFFWNDGLLDLLAGAGVCLIGLAWLFDLVPLGAVARAVLIPFWKPLRAKITEPRLGYVELSDVQQKRNRNFLAVSIVLGVLTFVAGVSGYLLVVTGFSANLNDLVVELIALSFITLGTGFVVLRIREILCCQNMRRRLLDQQPELTLPRCF